MREYIILKWVIFEKGIDGLFSIVKMSVFVKCLYNENFIVFFFSFRVFIVCVKFIKM